MWPIFSPLLLPWRPWRLGVRLLFPRLRVTVRRQVGSGGVGLDLFHVLAAGDDRGHRLVPQAPRQGPLGHVGPGRDFLAADALGLAQLVLDFLRVLLGPDVAGLERRSRLVF